MTAGSIVGDLDTGSDHSDRSDDLEVDRATRRELKAEAKAAARAQRAEAKAAARREKDELAAAAKAERDEAEAAEQAARESARVARQQEEQDDTDASETDARGPAGSLLRRLRKGGAEEDTSTSPATFSATPIADALAAEFPLPELSERPLSDLAEHETEEESGGRSARAVRRAKAAEAKAASRRSRDEAKAAKAAAKSEAHAARAATMAESVTARTDDSTEEPDESTDELVESADEPDDSVEQPDESTPDAPSETAVPAASRLEQQLAEAKQRVEAQSQQDDAEAKSRAIEEAARRDRAEAEAKSRAAKEESRRERDEAKAEAKAAKANARRERDEAKAEAKAAKATGRRERDDVSPARARTTTKADAKPAKDDIVEAPREPRVSLAQRLRQASGANDADPDAPAGKGRNALAVLAVVLGTLGFICSVVLAIGAFLVALSPHADSAVFNKVSSVCDALVGPLRDVFSFSGVNGDSKDALVAWGLGALGYLIVGLFAQTFLRSHSERQSS